LYLGYVNHRVALHCVPEKLCCFVCRERGAARVGNPVLKAAGGAVPNLQRVAKDFSTLARPAFLPCGVAVDHRVVRYVSGNDRASTDQRMPSNGDTTQDRSVSSDASTTLDERWQEIFSCIARKCTARRKHVRKHNTWPTKHVVFERHTFVHRNVVLNLRIVSNQRARADNDVLTDAASFSYPRTGHHVAEVPNVRLPTDHNIVIDIRRLVNGIHQVVAHITASVVEDGLEKTSRRWSRLDKLLPIFKRPLGTGRMQSERECQNLRTTVGALQTS